MARYVAQGFPEKYGLTANGIMLRKHLEENVMGLMDLWWEEYCLGSKRDQLSLQYSSWKKNFKITLMEEDAQKNCLCPLALHSVTLRQSDRRDAAPRRVCQSKEYRHSNILDAPCLAYVRFLNAPRR